MKQIIIIRKENMGDEGLFGTAFASPGDLTWSSSELSWVDENKDGKRDPNVSCIAQIRTTARLVLSPKRSTPEKPVYVYQLENVPDAVAVQIHKMNFVGRKSKGFQADAEACIGLGKGRGKLKNIYGNMQEAITGSTQAMKEFMDWANGDPIQVVISEQFPGGLDITPSSKGATT